MNTKTILKHITDYINADTKPLVLRTAKQKQKFISDLAVILNAVEQKNLRPGRADLGITHPNPKGASTAPTIMTPDKSAKGDEVLQATLSKRKGVNAW